MLAVLLCIARIMTAGMARRLRPVGAESVCCAKLRLASMIVRPMLLPLRFLARPLLIRGKINNGKIEINAERKGKRFRNSLRQTNQFCAD